MKTLEVRYIKKLENNNFGKILLNKQKGKSWQQLNKLGTY